MFVVNLSVDGAAGRALLVAALAASAFLIVRYWRTLGVYSRSVRWTLIALRFVALGMLACALAGLRVHYETQTPPRVLVRYARASNENAKVSLDSLRNEEREVAAQVISLLRGRGFEVVEDGSANGAEVSDLKDASYIASVLLTDGAMSSEEARREIEQASAAVGFAPVYVVTDLNELPGASVALENATLVSPALRGVPASVSCTVHARGMRGRESLLTISDDAKVQASARIAWTSDDERRALTLEVVPKVAGWTDYIARVEAAGGEVEGSREALLLSRPFTLYAEERRVRVLFFEGEPTWEAKFIRRALEQAGLFEVDYFAQVSRAASVGQSETVSETRENEAEQTNASAESVNVKSKDAPETKLHRTLASAASLNNYDCIIVGATPNAMLNGQEAARLSAWVERRGGGLIVLGGNSFNGSIAAPNGKLYSLLPASIDARALASESQELARAAPVETERRRAGVALTPTEAGAALHGYLNAMQETNAKFDTLTGQGFRVGAARPGATVLAVAGKADASGTSEMGAPLIISMRDGAGRVMLFAPADSWRIRTSASGEQDSAFGAFGALWQGLVLWSSAGARTSVEIVLSDGSPAAGNIVTAELRVRDALFAPLKIEKLNARLEPLAEDDNASIEGEMNRSSPQQEIVFAPDRNDASVWRARFVAPVRGRYNLRIDYEAGGESGSAEKLFGCVEPSLYENGAARDTLLRLAHERGGKMLTVKETDALAHDLSALPHVREPLRRVWEMRLWWPLVLIIPLLLSLEWCARRLWQID